MIALILLVIVVVTLAYVLWPVATRSTQPVERPAEPPPSALEDLEPPPGEGERGERRDDA